MITEEKMTHIIHLLLDGIWKDDLVDYADDELALKEAKKIGFEFVRKFESVHENAEKRIRSQKKPPPEFSRQWDTLYEKYLAEELQKIGG